MATSNETMVKLRKKLKYMNQEQRKQIAKLFSRIKLITKLLASNGTSVPLHD